MSAPNWDKERVERRIRKNGSESASSSGYSFGSPPAQGAMQPRTAPKTRDTSNSQPPVPAFIKQVRMVKKAQPIPVLTKQELLLALVRIEVTIRNGNFRFAARLSRDLAHQCMNASGH